MQGILHNLLACGKHQRSDHATHLLVYARQTSQSRATQQIDKESLYRVVYVVCDGDYRVAVLLAQLGKPRVAQAAGCHLHRFARALHLAHGVEAAVVALDAIFACVLLYQYLILVALCSTQREVAVRHAHRVAAIHTERHQHHRIHSTRYGEQNLILRRKEFFARDVLLKLVY